jgi:hypothetical protein
LPQPSENGWTARRSIATTTSKRSGTAPGRPACSTPRAAARVRTRCSLWPPGTKIASEELKGWAKELTLANLNSGYEQSLRRNKLCIDDGQGRTYLLDNGPEQAKVMLRADRADPENSALSKGKHQRTGHRSERAIGWTLALFRWRVRAPTAPQPAEWRGASTTTCFSLPSCLRALAAPADPASRSRSGRRPQAQAVSPGRRPRPSAQPRAQAAGPGRRPRPHAQAEGLGPRPRP